jgi:multidrug efflux pump subunit AcrB
VGKARQADWFERLFARLTNLYRWILNQVLAWRWVTVALFVFALVAGGALLGRLGGQFLPLIDDGRVLIKVKMPTGASVQETDRALRRIEKEIVEDPLIQSRFTLVGGQVRGLTTYEIANEGNIDIQLLPKAHRNVSTEEYVADLRKIVGKLQPPGGKVMVRQMPIKGIRGNRSADIVVEIRGQDMATLEGISYQTARALNAEGPFRNVFLSMDLSKPEYQIRVDRGKAAELGVSVSDVANGLRTLITGAVATRYRDGADYYDIRVLVPQERIDTIRQVENLPLTGAEGDLLRLRDIASVVPATGPVELVRKNQVKQITIEADVAGNDLAGAVRALGQVMAGIDIPPGYEFDIGGRAEMMSDMKQTTVVIFGFALFFSFIVLTVQFNNLKLPGLILGSVPVCMAGVVFMLFLTGIPLGATVAIGVLVVVAATVNDGVLLLTYARELNEKQGMATLQSIVEAASIRLRPRIMTTVTTMIGFVPLALNIEEGGDMLQPMAVAAIGGLGMEMLVAQFLMPCLFVILTRQRVV